MWAQALPTTTAHAQQRFVDTFDAYTSATIQEAEDRHRHNIRGIESYLIVRRGTSGMDVMFALLELKDALADNASTNPAIVRLELLIDMYIMGNVYDPFDRTHHSTQSFCNFLGHGFLHQGTRPRPRGTQSHHCGHAREEHRCQWGTAMDRRPSQRRGEGVSTGVGEDSRGEAVEQYVWGIGNLLRGADCWFFESERYFGTRGLLVQGTRRVDADL